MVSETFLLRLLDGLADVAKAIREHTEEMRVAEAASQAAATTRMEPYGKAMQAMMDHMQEMEANTERRQIESEGRADHRLATMEARMRDRGL